MNIYIFDGQRPTLQHECAVLRLFFKLATVAAGVDRLGTVFNQKNRILKQHLVCHLIVTPIYGTMFICSWK